MSGNYLERFLDRCMGVVETPTGFKCHCPNPNHGSDGKDSSPSLRITVGENGTILIQCRVGCPTEEVLKALGLNFSHLYPSPEEAPETPKVSRGFQGVSEEEVKLRDRVYRDLLNLLTLSHEDKLGLVNRGLSDQEIQLGGYKSLRNVDRFSVRSKLLDKYSEETLNTVPGLQNEIPESCVGLVIPVRGLNQKIVALKVRRKHDPKYVYFSSSDVPCGAPAHIPPGTTLRSLHPEVLRVTEGELKAHIAAHKTKTPTVGIAGSGAWDQVLPVLYHLKPEKVLLAPDGDFRTKLGVALNLLDLSEAVQDMGFELGLEEWDPVFKGVDDALKAGADITTTWGDAARKRIKSAWKTLAGLGDEDQGNSSLEDRKPCEFPVDVFPQKIKEYVSCAANQLQSPPDWISTGILVAVGRALGTTRSILLADGYEEYGNLYAIIVGPPGTLKSTSMEYAMSPIYRRQKRLNDKYMKEKAAREIFLKEEKLAKQSGEYPPAYVPPPGILEHIYMDNFTNEALVKRLHTNGTVRRKDTAVVIVSDEVRGFLLDFNAYRGGKGSDKQFYLKAWGLKSHKGDRMDDEKFVAVDKPFVSIFGGIQPDVLPCLETDKNMEDGFLHRLLFSFPQVNHVFCQPEETPRPTKNGGGEVSKLQKAKEEYEAAIYRLLLGCKKNQDGSAVALEFTEEGWKAWLAWQKKHAEETEKSPPSFRGVMAKQRAHMGRFCLILHMLRATCGEVGTFDETGKYLLDDGQVDEVTVERASKLVDYFISHYRDVARAFSFGPEDRKVEELVDLALDKHQGKISLRDIYKHRMFGCKGKKDAENLCKLAEDRNLGYLCNVNEKRVFHAYPKKKVKV